MGRQKERTSRNWEEYSRLLSASQAMKPAPRSAEIAALRFFDRWIRDEAILHTSLQGDSPEEQRLAIGRTVTHFRVVRSLKRSAEEALGVPRFEPVRECLATVTIQGASDDE